MPSIAVFNSSEDTIEILKTALEQNGYAVAAATSPTSRGVRST
jgi:CheY-like chemotaxis protein